MRRYGDIVYIYDYRYSITTVFLQYFYSSIATVLYYVLLQYTIAYESRHIDPYSDSQVMKFQ